MKHASYLILSLSNNNFPIIIVLHKPDEAPNECIVVFGPRDSCRVIYDRIKMKVGPKECAVKREKTRDPDNKPQNECLFIKAGLRLITHSIACSR
jgi:hypothetical protein